MEPVEEIETREGTRFPAVKVVLIVAAIALVAALAVFAVRVFQRAQALSLRSPVVALFSPDGRMLAVSVGEDTVLYDGVAFTPALTLAGAKGGTDFGAAFSPDSTALVVNQEVWSTADGSKLLSLDVFQVFQAAYAPDGSRLASFSLAGIDVWDPRDGSRQAHMDTAAGCSCQAGLAFGAGKVISFGNNHVITWDAATGAQSAAWQREGTLNSVALSRDGALLAVGDKTTVEIWDVASGRQLRSMTGSPGTAALMAFSPDNRFLAVGLSSGGKDESVALFDAQSGELLRSFPLKARVASLSFSPAGELLSAGAYNGAVTIWEARGGREVKALNFTDWPALYQQAARDTLRFK